MKIDISFDDGQIGDLKAARLLKKHGLVGTFYYPSTQVPRTIQASLKEMYDVVVVECGQEIGGHTVSHPSDMKDILDDKQLKFEVENNKFLVEHCLMKRPVTKFCYPRGRHNARVRKAVEDAGFKEARTTRVLQIHNDTGDPFQTPTTIHMFPREEYNGVDWFEVAKVQLEKALQAERDGETGVFFSLWGHTNEIERQNDWGRFEEMLAMLSPYGANGESAL